MRTRGRVAGLRCVTALGWLAIVLAATPWVASITFELGRIGLAVAICGTGALLLERHSLSAAHVYEAGKVAGRMESERSAPDPVRHLRVVDD